MASLPALYVDIDGVLAFQPEGSIIAVNARFGTSYLVAEATTYPWTATLPEAERAWLNASMPVITANLAPDTIAVNAVRKAKAAGYPVTIATERDPSLRDLTAAWLAYWQVPYDALAVVGKGGKADLLASRGGTEAILIDDDPAKELLAGNGLQVWVPPRPWTPKGDPPPGVWRFSSWRDVKKKLSLLLAAAPWMLRRPAGRVRRPLLPVRLLRLSRPALRRLRLGRVTLLRVAGRRLRGRCRPGHQRELPVVGGDELVRRDDVPLDRPRVNDPPVRRLQRDQARGLVPAPARRLDLRLRPRGERRVYPLHRHDRRRVLVRGRELLEHAPVTRPEAARFTPLPYLRPSGSRSWPWTSPVLHVRPMRQDGRSAAARSPAASWPAVRPP